MPTAKAIPARVWMWLGADPGATLFAMVSSTHPSRHHASVIAQAIATLGDMRGRIRAM